MLLPVSLQVITPWDVSGGADGKVDYEKLIREVSRDTGICLLHDFTAVITELVLKCYCSKQLDSLAAGCSLYWCCAG